MDVFKHGLNLILCIAFLIADYTVKCTLVEDAEERLLHDLGWLCNIHLSIVHFFIYLVLVSHVVDND